MTSGILLAGLQETGKTSYLALLYSAISTDQAGIVRLGHFHDDREYLNTISERLIRCEEAAHTQIEESRELALSLEIGDSEAFLRIPDLSGETWEHALTERRWPQTLEDRVLDAEGFILFVHSRQIDVGLTIGAAQAAERELLGDDVDADESPIDDGIVADGPDDESMSSGRGQPTQVSLVDLLQLLCERRNQRPARASVVISAWDLAGDSLSPATWMAQNCPLTDQYLFSNRSWLRARIWGVSAYGGDIRQEAIRAALLLEDVVKRACAVRSDGTLGSVEEPLLWAMGRLSP